MSDPLANISKIIEDNWEEVQDNMVKSWRKFTNKDVKGIKSFDDLVEKLQETYKVTEEEAKEKIYEFIEKNNLEINLSRLEELKKALVDSAADARDKISQTFDATKDKTEELATVATTYVKDNPFKAIGLGVLASLAIKKLLFGTKE